MTAELAAEELDGSPRTFVALRQALLDRKSKLPKRLAQVAAFTMANPDEIAFGTAASVAQSAQVQPSTLVRFAQALGYQGFSDLQSVFRERLRDRVPTYEERLRALRDHSDPAHRTGLLFEGFASAAEHSVGLLKDRLRPELIEIALSVLAPADTIYLIGQRRSFPVTAYMNYALGKLGVKNVLIGSAPGNDAETLSFATPNDAAISSELQPLRILDGRVLATDRREGDTGGRDHGQPLQPPAALRQGVVRGRRTGFPGISLDVGYPRAQHDAGRRDRGASRLKGISIPY